MNQRISKYLVIYSLFLIISGSIGYAVNPAHAITALLGGIGGGILMLIMSRLYRRNVMWALPAVNAATGVFALTFIWRAVTAWKQVWEGNAEKVFVATLLSLMFLISSVLLAILLRRR